MVSTAPTWLRICLAAMSGCASCYGRKDTCDSTCDASQVCIAGACRTSCQGDLDCVPDVCVLGFCQAATPLCSVDTDCDDLVACTRDVCSEEGCTHVPEDAACDDGLYCNGEETCAAAGCVAGDPVVCTDAFTCTDDACDEGARACESVPDDSRCDDGVYCNGAELCLGPSGNVGTGCAMGAVIVCDDGVSCTNDVCHEGARACESVPDDTRCDDLVYCNGVELCDVGGCIRTPNHCDDQVACTDDRCDEALRACVHEPDHAVCDNGLFCDGWERCSVALGCTTGTPPCNVSCEEVGQVCDGCLDPDQDGLCSSEDNCPDAFNPGQENIDGDTAGGDTAGDACDSVSPCPPNDPLIEGRFRLLYSTQSDRSAPLPLAGARLRRCRVYVFLEDRSNICGALFQVNAEAGHCEGLSQWDVRGSSSGNARPLCLGALGNGVGHQLQTTIWEGTPDLELNTGCPRCNGSRTSATFCTNFNVELPGPCDACTP